MNIRPLRWLLTGLLATLTMDLGAALGRSAGLTAGLPPQLLGRWFASLTRGGFTQSSILDVPAFRGELPLALAGHYLIGIGLTVTFCAWVQSQGQLRTSSVFLLALGFGALTNLLPWLVMFPSMGFGAFGNRADGSLLLFRTSLLNHLLFGLGLGSFGLLLNAY